jgi:hypothetical protein
LHLQTIDKKSKDLHRMNRVHKFSVENLYDAFERVLDRARCFSILFYGLGAIA